MLVFRNRNNFITNCIDFNFFIDLNTLSTSEKYWIFFNYRQPIVAEGTRSFGVLDLSEHNINRLSPEERKRLNNCLAMHLDVQISINLNIGKEPLSNIKVVNLEDTALMGLESFKEKDDLQENFNISENKELEIKTQAQVQEIPKKENIINFDKED